MKRKATAVWNGSGKDGKGYLTTQSTVLNKTQYSFSDDPSLINAPKGFKIKVTSVSISSGAGFVVPLLGSVMTMPGLPTHPSAEGIDVNEDGEITGLF